MAQIGWITRLWPGGVRVARQDRLIAPPRAATPCSRLSFASTAITKTAQKQPRVLPFLALYVRSGRRAVISVARTSQFCSRFRCPIWLQLAAAQNVDRVFPSIPNATPNDHSMILLGRETCESVSIRPGYEHIQRLQYEPRWSIALSPHPLSRVDERCVVDMTTEPIKTASELGELEPRVSRHETDQCLRHVLYANENRILQRVCGDEQN